MKLFNYIKKIAILSLTISLSNQAIASDMGDNLVEVKFGVISRIIEAVGEIVSVNIESGSNATEIIASIKRQQSNLKDMNLRLLLEHGHTIPQQYAFASDDFIPTTEQLQTPGLLGILAEYAGQKQSSESICNVS